MKGLILRIDFDCRICKKKQLTMAKQRGIIKIVGTLDELTFYRTRNGYVVRKKSSLTKQRVKTDPAFVRTRENNQEFKEAIRAGKLVRDAVRPLSLHASDGRLANRLVQLFMAVKNEDGTSIRGLRNVANGIATPTGEALVRNFEFNSNTSISSLLYNPYTIDALTGTISFAQLNPLQDLIFPSSSTHVALTAGFLGIDFTTGAYDLQFSLPTLLSPTTPAGPLTLVPTNTPSINTVHFYLLKLCFYQEINGELYLFADGGYNTLTVVDLHA